MLAWSEGTDNGRQKTRNHGYDVIVGGELFTDYSDHPHQTCAKPKTGNQQAPALPASFPLVGCLKAAWPERLLSEKVRTLALRRLRHGALPMIDRGDIRQAIDRYTISGLHCQALVMVSSSIKAGSLIAKFKEAGGTVREIDRRASHAIISRSGYLRIVTCQ